MSDTLALEFYGRSARVTSDWPEVIEALRLDFSWFEVESARAADIDVTIERRPPDFAVLGDVPAAFVTPRNVVFQQGGRTLVDWQGRALTVLDRRSGSALVQGEDEQLVHEAVYLGLLSRVGEHLDEHGLTRLHALGLAGEQGGVAVMLPSGGGKTTLALDALRDERVKLLSEDTPLLDRHGVLHPFPLRLGVNEGDLAMLSDVPSRRIERIEFQPKLTLGVRPLSHRFERAPQPLRHLVVGRRRLGSAAELTPLGRRSAVGPLLREAVVGVGVYQGMEFVLQRGMRDVARKAGVAGARSAHCAAALRGATVWRLDLGRDRERNWQALRPLLGPG